jgi:hypothetical protein
VLTISGSLVGMGAGLIKRGSACFSKPATCCWTATKPKSPSFDIGGDGGRSPTPAVAIFGCVSKLEGKEFSLLVEWMAFTDGSFKLYERKWLSFAARKVTGLSADSEGVCTVSLCQLKFTDSQQFTGPKSQAVGVVG